MLEIEFSDAGIPFEIFVDPSKYRGWTLVRVVADLRQTLGVILTTAAIRGEAIEQAAIEIVTAANAVTVINGELWSTPPNGIPQVIITDYASGELE